MQIPLQWRGGSWIGLGLVMLIGLSGARASAAADKYELLHVKGARNLSLPDMTEEELARIIPHKGTRILIYCNNNFLNSPTAFPSKAPSASLNLHSFNALYSYGYRNVFELQPLLDIHTTKIPFEGTEAAKR